MIFSCFPSFFTEVQYNRPVAIGCFFPCKIFETPSTKRFPPLILEQLFRTIEV